MSYFLVIFFAVYGGMHLYTFFRARAAFVFGTGATAGIAAAMLFMVLSPIIVRFLERGSLELPARLLALFGYSWMGALLLFVSASLVIDLWRLVLYLVSHLSGAELSALIPSAKLRFLAPLVLAAAASLYGFFEANDIRAERIVIATPKIPREAGRIRIAQISDVHIGLIVRGERIRKIAGILKDEAPDILVSTGDLVDGQSSEVDGISELLAGIRPRYGKYAVTGNHEYFAGLAHSTEFIKKAGFVLLKGSGATVAGILNIAGVEDPAAARYAPLKEGIEGEVLSGLPADRFTLLLKHRPEVDPASEGRFDLQLSGHTHRGQIFPFRFAVAQAYPYIAGLYRLDKGSQLYTSRGTGTWGPPIRVLSPPEVTIIDIVHGEAK